MTRIRYLHIGENDATSANFRHSHQREFFCPLVFWDGQWDHLFGLTSNRPRFYMGFDWSSRDVGEAPSIKQWIRLVSCLTFNLLRHLPVFRWVLNYRLEIPYYSVWHSIKTPSCQLGNTLFHCQNPLLPPWQHAIPLSKQSLASLATLYSTVKTPACQLGNTLIHEKNACCHIDKRYFWTESVAGWVAAVVDVPLSILCS